MLCLDDPVTARLAAAHDVITYGTHPDADVRAAAIETAGGVLRFTVSGATGSSARSTLPLRGMHNVRNALGAIAMADAVGVPFGDAVRALARFGGVARRFEVRGQHDGITLVDDYAHLPTEIAAVLEAAATSGDGWSRLVAVFQPNRYNRMAVLSPDYRDAFVYCRRGRDHRHLPVRPGTAPWRHRQARGRRGLRRPPGTAGGVAARTRRPGVVPGAELRSGDVCISMGCGDVAALPDEILARRPAAAVRGDRASTTAVELAAAFSAAEPSGTCPSVPLTTYRVGGRAALLVRVDDITDLVAVHRAVAATDLPVLIVGRGSNLLVADAWFRGLGPRPRALRVSVDIDGVTVTAGSAVSLPVLARQTVAAGLTGLEWAVGVPGSVGGGVRMNAGGHGSDMATVAHRGPRVRPAQRRGW